MGSLARRHGLIVAKKINRYKHANAKEMKNMMKCAGKLAEYVKDACDNVLDACEICPSTCRPPVKRKVAISDLNAAFKEELQAGFLYIWIHKERQEVLDIVDSGI